jgi:hypothetical protein
VPSTSSFLTGLRHRPKIVQRSTRWTGTRYFCYFTTSEPEYLLYYLSIITLGSMFVSVILFLLAGLVVRVSGYRSRGPGSIPGTTRFSWEAVGLKRGPLSLVSTTDERIQNSIQSLKTETESSLRNVVLRIKYRTMENNQKFNSYINLSSQTYFTIYITMSRVRGHWLLFKFLNISSRTMSLGFTQPLTEMRTRRSLWQVKRGRRVRQPNRHLRADCLRNVRSLTSHNPIGFHGLLQG